MKPTKIEVTDELLKDIALDALDMTRRQLEEKYHMSRPVIKRLLDKDLAKQVQKEFVNNLVEAAVREVKKELPEMTRLALEALKFNLEEKNLEAVKIYFKTLGLDVQEKRETGQSNNIQVILPSLNIPKEVPNESN